MNIEEKARIESLDDFERLPEGEWIEVEGGEVEVELFEEVTAKLLITADAVKIPVNEALYGRIKDKKISTLLCPKQAEARQPRCGVLHAGFSYGRYDVWMG
ncbi:MAG TPA: hypothetical protein ENN68_09925 [Methanomicrobia archaeon]|nr:hypothetical protein [Methanomicrobia archaeon]